MSLRRARAVGAPSPRLDAVLRAGQARTSAPQPRTFKPTPEAVEEQLTNIFGNERRANLNPPLVVQTSDGTVTISTTPSVWTGLTIKELVKLKLKPVNEAEFMENGYKGTVFKRALDSHRFYVHPNGANEIAYYVLARPYDDERPYTYK